MQLFANELSRQGIKISVITIHYPYSKQQYSWLGINVYPLNGNNKKYKGLLLKKEALKIAKRINKDSKIDYVHSFWLNESTRIGKSIASSLNVRLVATVMGQEMCTPGLGFNRWKKALFPVVALCDFQKLELKKKGVSPSHVIPWGVVPNTIQAKENDLICVGNLVPLKNVRYFVELCHEIAKSKSDLSAKIVGTGFLSSVLQSQINELGLSKNVELTGILPYNETQSIIAKSKVLIHPSQFEGFGMTIIEALASQTHVISTPVGIAAELEIPHLTENLEIDGAMVSLLLSSSAPEPKIFDIKSTVVAYRSIYGF